MSLSHTALIENLIVDIDIAMHEILRCYSTDTEIGRLAAQTHSAAHQLAKLVSREDLKAEMLFRGRV